MRRAIIAGSSGLIGRAIWQTMSNEMAWSLIIGWDIKHKSNMFEFIYGAENYDAFIDAIYPKFDMSIMAYETFYRTVAERMNDNGSIILLGSIYGSRAYSQASQKRVYGYCMLKAGLIGLVRDMAAEFGPRGIRCNLVSPGGVYDSQDEEFVNRYCERVPLGRMATSQDVANVVAFLASDKSSYITGQNIIVDGGFTCL